MHRRSRDRVRHNGRVVDLASRRPPRRGRGSVRTARASLRRAEKIWNAVALLAAVALVAIGSREGIDPLGVRDWLLGGVPPIRAAVSVSSGRGECRVTRVIDGDTVDLDCPGKGFVRTRLLGFDTPEVASPECASELALGSQATLALERRIRASGEMHVEFRGTDRYGRRLARLSLDGTDVARPMIAEGMARPYGGGARRSWCR